MKNVRYYRTLSLVLELLILQKVIYLKLLQNFGQEIFAILQKFPVQNSGISPPTDLSEISEITF